jgi:hypothetical protein
MSGETTLFDTADDGHLGGIFTGAWDAALRGIRLSGVDEFEGLAAQVQSASRAVPHHLTHVFVEVLKKAGVAVKDERRPARVTAAKKRKVSQKKRSPKKSHKR